MEASVSAAYADKHRAADLVLAYFLLDTAAYQADSVLAWLDHKGSLHAAYLKADILFQTGQTEAAQAALDSIPVFFQLSHEQQVAHSNKQSLFQLLESQADILQMDSLAVDSLSDIAQQPGLAGLQAKSLLDYAYDVEMEPNHDLPVPYEARLTSTSSVIETPPVFIQAFPNPTKTEVTFRYALPRKAKASIRLFNLMGQPIADIPLIPQAGYMDYSVTNLPDGIYYYQLLMDNRIRATGKIMFIH